MNINDYLRYIDYFSSQKYDDWYTDDVQVLLSAITLNGKAEVKAFYEHMAPLVHETIRVRHVDIGEDRIVARIWSDFYCLRDWDGFPVKPMVKGEMLRVPLTVTYRMRDGLFCHIAGRRDGS